MNKLILLTAVLATVAQAFPNALLEQMLRRGTDTKKRNIVCSGDASEDMNVCVAPLEFLSHPSSGMAMDNVETPEELAFVCGEMHSAKECVMDVHGQCGQGDMMSELTSSVVVGVVDYICLEENRQVILDNSDCWENKELAADIEKCGDVNPSPYANPCSIFNTMRSCMKKEVRSYCNNDAANFMDGLLYNALEPMASQLFSCNLSERVARSLWRMLPRSKK